MLPEALQGTRGAVSLVLSVAAATSSLAQQLPLESFSSRDGLGSDFVHHIVEDSHGYVWFSTRDGLSRYDGHSFVNYSTDQGLPRPTVRFLLEASDGRYWVATSEGGVVRFDPEACSAQARSPGPSGTCSSLFETLEGGPQSAYVLYEDEDRTIWAGGNGLYRLDPAERGFRRVDPGLPWPAAGEISSIVGDGEGGIWFNTSGHLVRRFRDGSTVAFAPGVPGAGVSQLLFDEETLWVGSNAGLFSLRPHAAGRLRGLGHTMTFREAGEVRHYTRADGLPHDVAGPVGRTHDGRLWVATQVALVAFDGERFTSFGAPAEGLPLLSARSLATDSSGNMWLASVELFRFAMDGFVSYDERDGLGASRQHAIFEDGRGDLHVVSHHWSIGRLREAGFESARANVPSDADDIWGSQMGFLDSRDRWWMLTSEALYRFPARADPARAAPDLVLTRERDLGGGSPFHLFEDSGGDIWIGTRATAGLLRWDAARGQLQTYSANEGLPSGAPWSFAEDRSGALWIGFYGGNLARFVDGRFEAFDEDDGIPGGSVSDLHVDASGRLWIATTDGGLGRIDVPTAARPAVRTYTTADGLRSMNVRCLTEDLLGRIYAGTVRGVDRLDPGSEKVRHYTRGEGLGSDFTMTARRDRLGRLWFGTSRGVSRLDPTEDRTPPLRSARISGLRIAGDSYPLSELGQHEVPAMTLGSNRNQINVAFEAPGSGLRFQHRLEGADDRWSEPTSQRSINFSNLAPGRYRFLVRTVAVDGTVDDRPATYPFTVLAPFWLRGWFLSLVALAAAGVVYATFRLRVARVLELERVRTQIATDLHDDIGASLSQMAIISEVARQEVGGGGQIGRRLSEIAGTSRELVDSMSDIVWSINPQRDALGDLTQRMRRFASDAFTARQVAFRFTAPDRLDTIRLRADVRRQVFLVFKEGVNNALRHSACKKAEVELSLKNGWIELRVADDGRGFDTGNGCEGHGLASMRKRAESLGGRLDVDSAADRGTRLTLRVPRSGRSSGRQSGRQSGRSSGHSTKPGARRNVS